MKTFLNQLGGQIGMGLLVFGLCVVSGCNSKQDVRSIGEGFGHQTHGSALPHSPTYVSLLRTNSIGKWVVVWQAISFRCQGDEPVWKKAIVFGGVTKHEQAEQGLVRLLYFSESTGVVDLTDSLAEKGGVTMKISPRLITLAQTDSSLNVMLQPKADVAYFGVHVTFDELAQMARTVIGRNKKGTFDGIDFFE